MALYTRESRDRVRDAVDFLELVSARTELRRAGPSRYEGLCPFHDERTPSFGIDPAQKVYYCFGCQAAGDVFTFVQETEGLDFKGALELLADRYGVELQREQEDPRQAESRRHRERLLVLLARTADYYQRYLWESREAEGARVYLKGRGLGEGVLRMFRVGYAPSAWDRVLSASRGGGFSQQELYATGLAQRSRQSGQPYDRFRSRIMFPLADMRGRVLGFGARAMREDQRPKYLNTSDNDLYHKGRHLYGSDLARAHAAKAGQGAGEVIVCEGYTDTIALHQAGMSNAVGLMGTALTSEQVGELARMARTVLLALDADSAGQQAMLRAYALAVRRKLKVRVVELPAGTDPAELLQRHGPEAMEALVKQAVPFERFSVERVLAAGDNSSAEGKDRMLEELGPVFETIPPSAMRMELTRLVSGRLALQESLVETLLSAGSGQGSPAGVPSGRAAWQVPPTAVPAPGGQGSASNAALGSELSRGEQTQRAFLALCIACGEQGEAALARVDVQAHFTSDLLRRAARHLRGHLSEPLGDRRVDATPGDGLGGKATSQDAGGPERLDSDPSLQALLAELVVEAGREPANPTMLQVQRLQLELARIDREIQAARMPARRPSGERHSRAAATREPEEGEPARWQAGSAVPAASAISGLAARRAEVKREFDRAYERALQETGG